MIYGRGKVWVICSEQFDPKFYFWESTVDEYWDKDITKAKFFTKLEDAQYFLDEIVENYKVYKLRKPETRYTSIIELELVQHLEP